MFMMMMMIKFLFVESVVAIFLQVQWQCVFLTSFHFVGSARYKHFAMAPCPIAVLLQWPRVRFPMVSLEFFTDIILPAELLRWSRLII